MIRWLRVSWPPLGWMALFAFFYVGAQGLFRWAEWRVGGPILDDHGKPMQPRLFGGYLILMTLIYGAWRASVFHPRTRLDYSQWLATTPWSSKKPLPLGPVHLVTQDVLLIGGVVLLTWLTRAEWGLFIPQLFLAVYSGLLAISFFTSGAWPWGYAVLFGVGLSVRLWHFMPASLSAGVLTYACAYWGLRQALARFPWKESWIDEHLVLTQKKMENRDGRTVGWPYGRLAPKHPGSELGIALHHALLLSALVGWGVYVALALVPSPIDREHSSRMFLGLVVTIAPVARLLTYCVGYLPPISFLGRLATFRWIIPGYDQIVVAPLLALFVGATMEVAGAIFGIDPLHARPAALAVVLAICLGVGPTLKTWRLTGNHRIAVTTLRAEAVKVG